MNACRFVLVRQGCEEVAERQRHMIDQIRVKQTRILPGAKKLSRLICSGSAHHHTGPRAASALHHADLTQGGTRSLVSNVRATERTSGGIHAKEIRERSCTIRASSR